MESDFSVPNEYKDSFKRLMPYIPAALRNDQQALEAILLYLKLGGDKLARVAIDAYNQTQRLNNAETQKRLREEAMLAEQMENLEDEKDEESTDEIDGDGVERSDF